MPKPILKMIKLLPPVPSNEMDRLLSLSEFDIDFTSLEKKFEDLTTLAAKVAGTEISLINLIDTFTQWSVARHGIDVEQMPREDSVCQYTIMDEDHFEIKDLSADERFVDKDYVNNPLNLRYYFGIPLKTNDGYNLGALCVLDTKDKKLTPEKVEMLRLIAKEIMSRLQTIKHLRDLKHKIANYKETNKRVAHDIRGPLSGIIGISEIISEQGDSNKLDEVLDFVNLIHKSSRSLLDLADEILKEEKSDAVELKNDEFNLNIFKEKLEKLYAVQAHNKKIDLIFSINAAQANIPFSKNKLLQIVGNLISNAIKFTPAEGKINVDMNLKYEHTGLTLKISVADTGAGMSEEVISKIIDGDQESTKGTSGEIGYGFGLAMVKHLVESLKGNIAVESELNKGTRFELTLPQ